MGHDATSSYEIAKNRYGPEGSGLEASGPGAYQTNAKNYQEAWEIALDVGQKTGNKLVLTARHCRSFSAIEELIENFIQTNPYDHKSILSLGCGRAEDLQNINRIFPDCELYGIDVSQNVLRVARENNREASFVCASADTIPFKNGLKFDGIIAGQIFDYPYYFYQKDELNKIFTGLSAHTRRNSRMYITIYGHPEDDDWLSDEPDEFSTFLSRTGTWKIIHNNLYSKTSVSPFATGIFLVAEKTVD